MKIICNGSVIEISDLTVSLLEKEALKSGITLIEGLNVDNLIDKVLFMRRVVDLEINRIYSSSEMLTESFANWRTTHNDFFHRFYSEMSMMKFMNQEHSIDEYPKLIELLNMIKEFEFKMKSKEMHEESRRFV